MSSDYCCWSRLVLSTISMPVLSELFIGAALTATNKVSNRSRTTMMNVAGDFTIDFAKYFIITLIVVLRIKLLEISIMQLFIHF